MREIWVNAKTQISYGGNPHLINCEFRTQLTKCGKFEIQLGHFPKGSPEAEIIKKGKGIEHANLVWEANVIVMPKQYKGRVITWGDSKEKVYKKLINKIIETCSKIC
jgi:hypothetical protein